MNKIKVLAISIATYCFISSGSFRKLILVIAQRAYSRFEHRDGKLANYIIDSLSVNEPWVQHIIEVAKVVPARRRYNYVRNVMKTAFSGTLKRKEVQDRLKISFPGLFIISPSDKCNLRCTLCYSKETQYSQVMSSDKFNSIIDQYTDYGVNYYLVTGGEPFLYPPLLKITDSHPFTVFFVYTNGTLINEDICSIIEKKSNIFPMISTDISSDLLDSVRGEGVFDIIATSEKLLEKHRIVYGKSIVITRQNLELLKNVAVVQSLFSGVCIAVMFVRYSGDNPAFVLSDDEYLDFTANVRRLRESVKGIMLNFPELEFTYFGGCVRGKYLVHIRSNGDVESCPFAHEKIGNIYEKDMHSILLDMYSYGCNHDCGNCSSRCIGRQ
jgi:MoaA/NifB/PqqE/SkfB family radical SAM enzyme